jgi:quercetin dioxygenase-like cupin family protein
MAASLGTPRSASTEAALDRWKVAVPVVLHAEVPAQSFAKGSLYRMLVGDEEGSTPICVGLQFCEPGYESVLHSHPYLETITILTGQGEAWSEDAYQVIRLEPGVTVVFPPNVKHRFWVSGTQPLEILGVHASPRRIVVPHQERCDAEVP